MRKHTNKTGWHSYQNIKNERYLINVDCCMPGSTKENPPQPKWAFLV